ncbi:CDP-alcohol phosphatidyltransferase family protein [Planomonospora corallina]|uniref:CDP-alcohol phosphatidyltransferase family protein n=1 Tax=Planomonospora corallina TaxID=1806052 RepID=A0ABV8I3P2_9ACTN
MRAYSLDDVRTTCKQKDSWWTVFFVDPVACRLTVVAANRTDVTPNALTCLSMVLGLGAAAAFALGQLAAGAVLFYVSFTVDCMDGKIARLKGTGTLFGQWVDFVGDRVRELCCAAGLAFGQYAATGELAYVLLGAGVAVLDLFRYVNSSQMKRVREAVREIRGPQEHAAGEHTGPYAAGGYAGPYAAGLSTGSYAVGSPAGEYVPYGAVPQAGGSAELYGAAPRSWRARALEGYRALGRFLARYRVRTHLMSGIEFHAAVFVLAPLLGAGALLPVSVTAGALLLLNEAFLVYKLWRLTRTAVPAVPVPRGPQRVSV